MIPLFLGLTLANLTALLATIALGYAAMPATSALRSWHMLAGALTALLCVAVHCIVFTYFIATAKWIQHAATVKRLDADYTAPTRSFKAQAFPAALAAMAIVFITAVFGAATDNQIISPAWHHLLALTAFAVNLAAAAIEYNAISHNGQLIDQILADAPRGEIQSRAL